MRLVVLSNVLGLSAAMLGLAFFDLSLFSAVAIWVLSGPVGAALALVSALAQQSGGQRLPAADCMSVEVGASQRAA